jgi:hypothetical protein
MHQLLSLFLIFRSYGLNYSDHSFSVYYASNFFLYLSHDRKILRDSIDVSKSYFFFYYYFALYASFSWINPLTVYSILFKYSNY